MKTDAEIRDLAGLPDHTNPDITNPIYIYGFLRGWRACENQENYGEIPGDAHSFEVFAIKDCEESPTGKQAFIGFKISNGNFCFVGVPYTEPQEIISIKKAMKKEDLKNYSQEELVDIFVSLMVETAAFEKAFGILDKNIKYGNFCFVGVPYTEPQEIISIKKAMKKEDLKNYSQEELVDIFVSLMNEMEKEGNRHMEEYKKNDDIAMYSYGGALITRVNRIKAMISLKNQEKEDYER